MRPDGLVHADGAAIAAGNGAPSLRVPDGINIFSAQYAREGDDLVIAAEGSPPLSVTDYFADASPAALVAPNGAVLSGNTVELLAGPRAPGQYAQADAPEGAVAIGEVETLSGPCTATRVTGETVELGRGDPVFQGDVVETGAGATLGLRLEDGTLASMSAESRLVLNEFVFEAGGSDNWMLVDLVEGAFAFLTGAIAPSGGMEITTPVAVMAIRGTMPVAFVAGDGGASQFFAASDKDYELLHKTTGELLAVISSEAGFSLSSPDAPLETIQIDPDRLDEINELLDVLNDTAAEAELLGIQTASGFHAYNGFGSIDGNLAALYDFLLLLHDSLTEEAVLEVEDADQFLMAEAELIASPDEALTEEMKSIEIDVLGNDLHPQGGNLTIIFADVSNGQGTVEIVDGENGQFLFYDPGTAFDYLAKDEQTDVEITYMVSDSTGAVASTTVTVTLTGINQPPVIAAIGETRLDEQTDTQPLNTTIELPFTDIDLNNVGHTAAVTGVTAQGDLGSLTDEELIGLLTPGTVTKNAGDNNGTVALTFTAGSTVFDYLAEGDDVTLTYTVEIDDQDGGTSTQEVVVTVTGTNDKPIVSGAVTGGATDGGTASTLDALANASDVDGDTLSVVDVPQTLPGGVTFDAATQTFTLDPSHADYQSLAAGATTTVEVAYGVSDGTATTAATVSWTVTGSNDGASITGETSGTVDEDATANTVSGNLDASDVDDTDDAWQAVTAGTASDEGYGTYAIDAAGNWTYTLDNGNPAVDALNADDTLTDTFTVETVDGTQQQVTITITGSNDAPVIDAARSVVAGTVVEAGLDEEHKDVGDPHASGQVVADDVDDGAELSYSAKPAAGAYGTFAVDSRTGAWTYTLDDAKAEQLALGDSISEVFTVEVQDEHGASDQVDVTVTVEGSNDAPETDDVSGLSGHAGSAIEVTLSGSDVDGTVDAFAITTAPSGGKLYLDPDGQTLVNPDDIAAIDNQATIYFIPDLGTTGDVSFEYAAVDEFGAQDQTPATVEVTVETATLYLMIHQDSWQGGADLPTFDGFQVTVGGVTYDLGELTVVASDFYRQDDEDGFTLGVGTGSGGKERFVVFEIEGVPGGASVDISFDYKVTESQGSSKDNGIRFYAGDSQDDMVIVYDGDEDPAFTGDDEKNLEFSSRVLSFNYAIVAGVLAVDDVELTGSIDPIILDLGEPGIALSGTTTFDLNADNQAETIAWTDNEDGMLVMDLDGSGAIESGNEVFSPYFDGGGFADALDALESLDGNGDGVMDAGDDAFADLLVWIDSNTDGVSQDGEVVSLADLGITLLDLNAAGVHYSIDGQAIIAEGQFTYGDGSTGDYVAVELDELLSTSEPLASNEEGDADAAGQLFAVTDLSIHEVIVDYREGDVIDLTQLGFALATGDSVEAFVQYESDTGGLSVDVDGAAGPAEFELAAELEMPPPSVMVRITDGHETSDVEIV